MDSVPLNTDLAELAKLQDKLEEILLDQLGIFIEEHPAANSARFGVAVFLGVAGRIGISHLGADTTAKCMEDVAATVRSHGKKKSKVH
jgi:hypothetical protein